MIVASLLNKDYVFCFSGPSPDGIPFRTCLPRLFPQQASQRPGRSGRRQPATPCGGGKKISAPKLDLGADWSELSRRSHPRIVILAQAAACLPAFSLACPW